MASTRWSRPWRRSSTSVGKTGAQCCRALQYAVRTERVCEFKISWLTDYRIVGGSRYIREMRSPISERKLVFLLGCGQFLNTLDFAMVLPLGPDFAKALGIPVSKLGMVGGSYLAA